MSKVARQTMAVDSCCAPLLQAPLDEAGAGLITKVKQGRWVVCSIVAKRLAALRDVLSV